MIREDCIKAGINYDTGVNRFCGNAEMFEKFLRKFLEDQTFAGLRTAISGNDADQAFQFAHTLKGVAGNLSLDSLLSALDPVVEALRISDIMKARELFPLVEAEYMRSIEFIKQ